MLVGQTVLGGFHGRRGNAVKDYRGLLRCSHLQQAFFEVNFLGQLCAKSVGDASEQPLRGVVLVKSKALKIAERGRKRRECLSRVAQRDDTRTFDPRSPEFDVDPRASN